MRKLKEVLRLHSLGLNHQQIARSCQIAQSTVHQYLKTAAAAGVTWPLPADWDEGQLEQALFGKTQLHSRRQNFRTLYCFFAIEHDRRRILHFNCTQHPTTECIIQQLREALPLPCPFEYALFDRDAKFGGDVVAFLNASGIKRCERLYRVGGRTESRNAGLAVFVGN